MAAPDSARAIPALTQITKNIVKDLKLAWQFRTGGEKGSRDPEETTNEVTPLKIGDLLYACSPHQIVFALEAATDRLRWKFDPKVDKNFQHLTCRGVSYHETEPGAVTADGAPAPTECAKCMFLPTNDGWMSALDAENGTPCESSGLAARDR